MSFPPRPRPSRSAIAENAQKLRLEFVLVLLAAERDGVRERMRAHHQHVVWLGVLQDRVDRLKPGDERVSFGLGDLCPGVSDNFREIVRGGRLPAFGPHGLGAAYAAALCPLSARWFSIDSRITSLTRQRRRTARTFSRQVGDAQRWSILPSGGVLATAVPSPFSCLGSSTARTARACPLWLHLPRRNDKAHCRTCQTT